MRDFHTNKNNIKYHYLFLIQKSNLNYGKYFYSNY